MRQSYELQEDSTVYQMIAGRMIEAFSDKCVKDTATVTAECAGVWSSR